MSWIICSSQSTKLDQKHSENVKNLGYFGTSCLSSSVGKFLLGAIALISILINSSLNAEAVGSKNAAIVKALTNVLPTGVFGSLEFLTNATSGVDEWHRVMARMAKEQPLYKLCDDGDKKCPEYLADWRIQLKSWSGDAEQVKLREVNDWVNHRIRYTDDSIAFGKLDYWASPAESLKGRGDCEDYAIAKYASLKALGIPEENLRIVIVNDMRKNLGHAVLSVHTSQGVFILDNQNRMPLRDSMISYYNPIYSINASTRWINIATRRVKTLDVDSDIVASNSSPNEVLDNGNATSAGLTDDAAQIKLRPSFAMADLTGLEEASKVNLDEVAVDLHLDSEAMVSAVGSNLGPNFVGPLHEIQ